MMKQNLLKSRRLLASVSASILTVSLSMAGCQARGQAPSADSGISHPAEITESRQAGQDSPEEAQTDRADTDASSAPAAGQSSEGSGNPQPSGSIDQAAVQEFDQMTAELYEALVSSDYLTQRKFYQSPAAFSDTDTICDPALPDLSETAWNQQLETVKSLKFQLGTIERSHLPSDRQDLYDLLTLYADAELKKEGFASFRILHDLSPDQGLMVQIPRNLNALSFTCPQDVEDYFLLLADYPRLFKELADLGREGAEEGLHFTEQWRKDAAAACAPYCLTEDHNSLISSFPHRLDQIPGLTEKERADYIQRNQEAVTQYVIPSYQKLTQDIQTLPVQALEYEGLCGQTGGRSYYRYLVNRGSGSSFQDIRLLKNRIEDQLKQNTQTLNELLDQSPDAKAALESLPAYSVIPDDTLAFLQRETDKHFPAPPSGERAQDMACTIEVIPVEQEDLWALPTAGHLFFDSAFFRPDMDSGQSAAKAESDTGANQDKKATSPASAVQRFFINQHTADQQGILYAALSQVGFPGQAYRRHYQLSQTRTPLLTALSFPGWEQGWDLYGRSYAISFDNGLTPEARQIARLSLSSSKAIHALIDIQVNYYGWNEKDVQDFLTDRYHLAEDEIAEALYRKAVYAPAESVIEYAGYLEIRQMKSQAQSELGAAFDEMAFHRFLLDSGAAPFGLIRDRLKSWMIRQNAGKIGN